MRRSQASESSNRHMSNQLVHHDDRPLLPTTAIGLPSARNWVVVRPLGDAGADTARLAASAIKDKFLGDDW